MYRKIKRAGDFLIAGVGIVVLSPLFLVIMLAIRLDSPGPVVFRQKRVGIHKKLFEIYKFRTMKVDAPREVPTHLCTEAKNYLTGIGGFLRKSSLDELPQLLNILKGDMSLIGPRPALWNQYDLLVERDKYGANDVLPGLTGWAQINGRDELEICEKARLDGEYVKRFGFGMDMRCFWGSFKKVLTGEGVLGGKRKG